MIRALPSKPRVDWVDIAKGFCIIFVVMMHSTLGVGDAMGSSGFMHYVVDFARPFRMPDFFLIAGLFLSRVIERDWRTYLDRKVVYFFYFYALWVSIQFGLKAPSMMADKSIIEIIGAYFMAYIQPFGTLWFIYILPIFFIVTKLVKPVSVWVIFVMAALLEIAPLHTGFLLIDEFAARYVYFFAGYAFAPFIFKFAEKMHHYKFYAFLGLIIWGIFNALGVFIFVAGHSFASLPFISLLFGFAGAGAVIALSVLLVGSFIGDGLRFVGFRSIVIYLSFFLPMAVSRIILIKSGFMSDVGVISMFVTISAVIAPLILYWIIEKINFGRFLFERPSWAALKDNAVQKAQI